MIMLSLQMSIKDTVCQTLCKNTRDCCSFYHLCTLDTFTCLCKAKRLFLYLLSFGAALNSFSGFHLCLWSLCTLWNGHRDWRRWMLCFHSFYHAAMKVILLCGDDYIWMKSDFFWERGGEKRATGRLDLFLWSQILTLCDLPLCLPPSLLCSPLF